MILKYRQVRVFSQNSAYALLGQSQFMEFKMKTCFLFMIVTFLETTFTIIQIALVKMKASMNGMFLKKEECTLFT